MRKISVALVCLAVMVAMTGCGGGKTADQPTSAGAEPQPKKPAPAGKPYDCQYFSFTVAEGWEAGPLTFGMVNVLPKGQASPGLYFKFEGDGNAVGTAEQSINTMIADYGGSPMETTLIAGTEFKTTTYSYSGMTQTMHVAFRNGTKITITIEGAGAKENPDIKAMLASVALK
jgi:hypothetical protein